MLNKNYYTTYINAHILHSSTGYIPIAIELILL